MLFRSVGGLTGAYNFAAQIPGAVVGGLATGPAAIAHAISPDTMPSASDALAEGMDLLQIHPTGTVGEGEQAAEQAVALPFEKGAEAGGNILAGATAPTNITPADQLKARFGIKVPEISAPDSPDIARGRYGINLPKAKLVTEAEREAVSRTGGEALANIIMSLAGGKKGADIVDGKPKTPPGTGGGIPEITPEQARIIGLEHVSGRTAGASEGGNVFDQFDAASKTADEAAERVHKPVEVSEAAPTENVQLQGTEDEKAQDALREHSEQPSTRGIDVQPGKMTNVELADNFEPAAEPTTKGVHVQEIPQIGRAHV